MKKYSSILFSGIDSIDVINGESVEFIFGKELTVDETATLMIKSDYQLTLELAFDTEEQVEAIISELYNLKSLLRDAKKSSTENTD